LLGSVIAGEVPKTCDGKNRYKRSARVSLQLGLVLALGCALIANLAFLCKHRGAVAAPAVDMRHPIRSAVGLFRAKWWAIGFALAFGAWGLHVAAISMAPLSLVEAVIAGGLVILAVLAERWFGLTLGKREWLGLCMSAAGLAFLAITVQGASAGDDSASYSIAAMTAFEGGLVGIGALLVLSGQVEQAPRRRGVMLGAAAGVLFGVSTVSIKALTGTVPEDLISIVSPWTVVAIAASIGAFYASARGLQIGAAIPVITLMSVAATVSNILGGIIVFGDPVGSDALGIVMRSLAFALVIVAAALMPAPLRAAEARA
jgi:drug/metabolite transporter (DMT)-like permease